MWFRLALGAVASALSRRRSYSTHFFLFFPSSQCSSFAAASCLDCGLDGSCAPGRWVVLFIQRSHASGSNQY